MIEMITLYLEQTPPLISEMRNSFQKKNWEALRAAVHKMIPSFSIMGISSEFEQIAIHIQEFAARQEPLDAISDMVTQLENICKQACDELTKELNNIKKELHEKQ